jgi:hypothetical protein
VSLSSSYTLSSELFLTAQLTQQVTIFLTDMSNFDKVVELRGKWFSPPYPTDTIV